MIRPVESVVLSAIGNGLKMKLVQTLGTAIVPNADASRRKVSTGVNAVVVHLRVCVAINAKIVSKLPWLKILPRQTVDVETQRRSSTLDIYSLIY